MVKDLVIILVSGLVGLLVFLIIRMRVRRKPIMEHHNCRCSPIERGEESRVSPSADPEEEDLAPEAFQRILVDLSKTLGENMIKSSLASDRQVNYTWSGLMDGSVEIYRRKQA